MINLTRAQVDELLGHPAVLDPAINGDVLIIGDPEGELGPVGSLVVITDDPAIQMGLAESLTDVLGPVLGAAVRASARFGRIEGSGRAVCYPDVIVPEP